MIEIAIDGHDNDEFLEKTRPVIKIEQFLGKNLTDYRLKAKELLSAFGDEQIVIVRSFQDNFSVNLFALALFIESFHMQKVPDCVVFKVKDAEAALKQYKPYVALTIGLKYVMRLCSEDVKTIYKEIGNLGYLGLTVKNDYARNKIFISLAGKDAVKKIITFNTLEALVVTGVLKSLALAKKGASIEAEINVVEETASIDEERIITQVCEMVHPWIN